MEYLAGNIKLNKSKKRQLAMGSFGKMKKTISNIFKKITEKYERFTENRWAVFVVLSFFILFSSLYKISSMQFLGDEFCHFRNAAIFAGERGFCEYFVRHIDAGLFPAILAVPAYLLFGWSILTTRITSAIISILSIVLAYLTVKNFFGKKIAVLSAAVYSLLPYWIYLSKYSYSFALFSMLILYSLSLWHKKRDEKYLMMCSFFCGLSLSRMLLLLYFVVPVFLVRVFLFRKRLTWKDLLLFFVGFSPYLIVFFRYNLSSVWADSLFSENGFFANMGVTTDGHSNLRILSNLLLKLKHLGTYYKMPRILPPSQDFLWIIPLAFIILSSVYFAFFKRKKPEIVLVIVTWVFTFLSMFSITNMKELHMGVLSIVPVALVVSFLYEKKRAFVPLLLCYLIFALAWYTVPKNELNTFNNITHLPEDLVLLDEILNYFRDIGIENCFGESYTSSISFLSKCSLECWPIVVTDTQYDLDINLTKMDYFVNEHKGTRTAIVVYNDTLYWEKRYISALQELGVFPNRTFGKFCVYVI